MPDKPETSEKPAEADKPATSKKPAAAAKPKKPVKKKKPVFDPYREALVMETSTVWPEENADLAPEAKQKIEEALHADPEKCKGMEYVRLHTGFCRQITVKPDDIERMGGS